VEPPAIFAKVIRDAPLDQTPSGTDDGWTKDEYLAEFRLAELRELAVGLPPGIQEAIFWRNAARLLKLEDTP
jgi:hypothetical protein